MYVWQMNDGSWRISLTTQAQYTTPLPLADAIRVNTRAMELYKGVYKTKRDADRAVTGINVILSA